MGPDQFQRDPYPHANVLPRLARISIWMPGVEFKGEIENVEDLEVVEKLIEKIKKNGNPTGMAPQ